MASSYIKAPKVSPLPTPSFNHWHFHYPIRGNYLNQWQPVYYATRSRPSVERMQRLGERRRALAAEAAFRTRRGELLEQLKKGSNPAAAAAGSGGVTSARSAREDLVATCADLHSVGLVSVAAPAIDHLTQAGLLTPAHQAQLLEGLGAGGVVAMLSATQTNSFEHEAWKRAADWAGGERSAEAARLLDSVAHSKLTAAHFNGAMATYLTCGFDKAERVHRQVYDLMGVHRVAPNARTYLRVLQSLAITGNTAEAEAVLSFLRHRCPDSLTVEMYNALMGGWLLERDYQKVDELWAELTTRRVPAPNATTADLMLRSILQLAQTPLAEPHVAHTQYNDVERKRIPLIVDQMKKLGIPLTALPPATQWEVKKAEDQFSIHREHFYTFGRAVKQFDFMEFRRRAEAIEDVVELSPPLLGQSTRSDGTVPAATHTMAAPVEGHMPWEKPALLDMLHDVKVNERNERTMDKFVLGADAVHDRGQTWMTDVPETRYDKLYGFTNPRLSQVGVRRHLLGEHPDKEARLASDRRIVAKTLATARRVRSPVDRQRTHRPEDY